MSPSVQLSLVVRSIARAPVIPPTSNETDAMSVAVPGWNWSSIPSPDCTMPVFELPSGPKCIA